MGIELVSLIRHRVCMFFHQPPTGGWVVCATTGRLRADRVKTLLLFGGVPFSVHDGPPYGGRFEGPFFYCFPRHRYPREGACLCLVTAPPKYSPLAGGNDSGTGVGSGSTKKKCWVDNVVPLVYWLGQVMLLTDRYQNGPV